MDLDVEGAAAVVARLGRGPAVVHDVSVQVMQRVALRLHADVHDNRISGQLLGVRTGTTRRALFQRVYLAGEDIYAVVGVDVTKAPGARANEFGAVIRPVNHEFLTVPIGNALTGKKVQKFDARTLFQNPRSLGYVGAFVAKHVIFGKKADGSIDPLFALKRSVTLKKVGYLASAREAMAKWLPEETDRLVDATVTVIGGTRG